MCDQHPRHADRDLAALSHERGDHQDHERGAGDNAAEALVEFWRGRAAHQHLPGNHERDAFIGVFAGAGDQWGAADQKFHVKDQRGQDGCDGAGDGDKTDHGGGIARADHQWKGLQSERRAADIKFDERNFDPSIFWQLADAGKPERGQLLPIGGRSAGSFARAVRGVQRALHFPGYRSIE